MRPRWGQVRKFCATQGYRETRTDHYYFDKVMPDGSSSGTKVSFGKDGDEVPPELWRRVWSRQLRLASEDEFWKGLDGQSVSYAIPTTPEPVAPLRPYLERFLRGTLHWSDEQIAATTNEQAQDLLNAHYSGTLREQEPRASQGHGNDDE